MDGRAFGDGEGNLSQGSRVGGNSLVERWAVPTLQLLTFRFTRRR